MPKMSLQVLKLIQVYQKSQQNLINTIAEKSTRGNIVDFEKDLLRQVNEELAYLNNYTSKWTNEIIPNEYYKSAEDVNDYFKGVGINIPNPYVFSRLNKDAVEMIVNNMIDDLTDATNYVGRQIKDQIRQISLDVVANKFTQGQTVREAKKQLVNSLIDSGINGIKDKRGRNISLDAYAQTVVRSTTAETTNKSTMNQLQQNGFDLVKMSEHNTCCPVCLMYQGRVFSISGKDKRFPKLDIAFAGGFSNIHPNCKHRLMPYIEEFNDVEKDIAFSNRPFDIDPRSKAEIDTYNKQQKEKQILRNDKRQWERYKFALPNDTPKTLSGFRKSKYSDSENWKQLSHDYRSLRQSDSNG